MNNFTEIIQKIHLPFSGLQTYFDLGTSQTRIAIKDKGIVLKEATCLGLNKKIKEYIFFGKEAKAIIGKVPEFIQITKPVVNGILSDFDAEVALLKKFIERSIYPYMTKYTLIKPNIEALTAITSIATEIEQKAAEEALLKAGVSRVFLIEKPIVSALGCGFNVFAHRPIFIVDLGGGLIEIAVISGGGIVLQKTLRNGGDHMNKLMYNYAYLKHGIILGETTCEDLKINLLNFADKEKTSIVRGKSLETGLPKSVKIRSSDVKEALLTHINQIADAVKEVVELSPPEIVDEIYQNGIILTGGLANVENIDKFFTNELKIDAAVPESPEDATINGLIKLGRNRQSLYQLKIS